MGLGACEFKACRDLAFGNVGVSAGCRIKNDTNDLHMVMYCQISCAPSCSHLKAVHVYDSLTLNYRVCLGLWD